MGWDLEPDTHANGHSRGSVENVRLVRSSGKSVLKALIVGSYDNSPSHDRGARLQRDSGSTPLGVTRDQDRNEKRGKVLQRKSVQFTQ